MKAPALRLRHRGGSASSHLLPSCLCTPTTPRGGSRRNYYEVLQVSKTADEATIKRAYRKLAVKWHPVRTCPNNTLRAALPAETDWWTACVYTGQEPGRRGGERPVCGDQQRCAVLLL